MIINKSSNNSTNLDWATIIILTIIAAFFPIIGLCLSVMFFRQKYAPWLFIAFSFYFGWFYAPQLDLLVHYEHFKTLNGKSLLQSWADLNTIRLGKEVYPVLFKYTVGLISDSQNLFSACACTVYSSFFVFGILIPLYPLYKQNMSIPSWLLFLGVIFSVEFYWFLGFRFWSGAFVFIGFYLRYINSGESKYLWLSALCTCFHYSLLTLFAVAFINHFLQNNFYLYYGVLIASFIIRFSNFSFLRFIGGLRILDGYAKETISNESIRISVEKLAVEHREFGNQFYLLREQFAIIGPLIAIYILYKKFGNSFFIKYNKLWSFCILILSLANFGYSDLTFFDRFFKIALLLFYIFAYMFTMSEQNKLTIKSQLNIILVLTIPVLYLIITPLVEQRESLLDIKLWFSNLFIS